MSCESTIIEATTKKTAISVSGLGKCYQLYDKPIHRMVQSLIGSRWRLYREFWALRGIDFEVRHGETLGIIGRNGAGKSTLLQLIAGTLKATEGKVATNGRIAALLELGSGFNPDFTGRQNVYLNASILGLARAEIDARIGDILAYADIGDFVDQPIRNYSTGMVMRLAFAVVAHVDADILIVDEALAVGDAFFMQKCMRFLRDFRKRGTMLFVSHDGGAVTSLCDRAIWLEHGRIQRIGDARMVMEAYMEASLIERQGGVGTRGDAKVRLQPEKKERRINLRQELIDRSVLRNDMLVFPFRPDVEGFGEHKARVTHVAFCDGAGQPVAVVLAGEQVTLEIELVAEHDIDNVIVGFYIKDRLGQLLLGDNTVLSDEGDFGVSAGESFRARFCFEMPRLSAADYFITVGVAEGTQEHHVIQHWLHEALRFTAMGGGYATGLVGVPMHDVSLERVADEL
ncbi:ABC transporter ATP-binding protein [Dyella psychrodurans]|uniref:ABC transporter ATP-binding protein n=1 Tax=Dyella psychrodurans TaxID=1927960 RepID=A0A370X4S8_9GAMM|nr:ABC transporter ATP-binding protein [Dyella psychrodurans]RDS83398.1 ABC transporter ATP-binding protein [Dyella psychrodurans]